MEDHTLAGKLEVAPVGFAVIEGPAMTFTAANRRYCQMVGREDVVGRAWADVFPELVGTPTHDAVRSAYAGTRVEVSEFPVALMREGAIRDGYYTFSLDPTPGAEGTVDGLVVLAVEVTELVVRRKEAEALAADLRASEARYRTLFSAIDDGFCLLEMMFDGEGRPVDYRFLDANEAFMRHTGLHEPLGKTARELVPDLDQSWFERYGRVATTGEPLRFENDAPAMDRTFEVFATRVGDASLRQVGLIFRDITQQHRVEMARASLLVAEQVARREAEAANRLKDEFLATVSHELRTPLNAMLGWVTMLRGGRLTAEKATTALEAIERNARAQGQLIEDLLDVSRILEGKLRLEVQPTNAALVIEGALETVRPAAEAKGIRLQATLSSGAIIMADAQRLGQIVWNLLSNAVKFTPRGGRVHVVCSQHESAVAITVSDTGAGIPAEFLPFVFDRFRQADGSSTRVQAGLGLGLSIVRHLVEAHGGTVTVASDGPGAGAHFEVRLPIALVRREEPAPLSALQDRSSDLGVPCPPELDGLEIVAVDDEADSREMLRVLLEDCGVRVRVASSAAEALRLVEERRPHVVVSDIGMPVEDGFALIKKLRGLGAQHGGTVPVVALTAYARSEDRTRCLLAGFDSHVTKPVEPMELLAVIASVARADSGRPGR